LPGTMPYTICERGIRVAPDDAAGFAEGLARLVDDEKLRATMGELGRRFVEQNYAKERLLTDVSELYQQLLRNQTEAVSTPVGQTSVAR